MLYLVLKCFRYLLVVLSLALFITGSTYVHYNVMLLGIMLFWSNNIIYCLENIKNRVFFLFFNFMIYVFLLSRPSISMLRGDNWWHFQNVDVMFALNSLMLTLVFLLVGEYIAETRINLKAIKNSYTIPKESPDFLKSLKIVSLILLYISMAFYFILEAEKLIYMRNRDYVEFYTTFKTSLPYIITVFASMYKYLLCIFLASMPKKSEAFVPLSLYVISAVPSLIIGMRNPIVLNIIFVILYYFIRDILGSKEKWLGLVEKSLLILMAPFSIVALGMLNYIREGSKFNGGFFDIIIDFFYKQGVSFDVLCIGHNSIPKIKYTGFVNYTFGGIIDYFSHSTLAQVLFGAKSLGTGNNINMALYSNSFAHRMSYVSRGQEYLDGHGWGSSYLLETFADFGYIGIIIFSLLMGVLFAHIITIIKKGSLYSTIMLVILTGIYFCPRDSALGWINFLLYAQFIVPVFFCYILAKLCTKSYSLKNHIIYKSSSRKSNLKGEFKYV